MTAAARHSPPLLAELALRAGAPARWRGAEESWSSVGFEPWSFDASDAAVRPAETRHLGDGSCHTAVDSVIALRSCRDGLPFVLN